MIQKITQSVLYKNTFIYVATRIINKIVPFLLLPILTAYLTPSDYGIVATFDSYVAIVMVFIHLSLMGAISVNYFKFTKDQLKIYIINVILIVFASTCIVFVLLSPFQEQISLRLEIPIEWLYIGIFMSLGQFFTELNLGLWQVEQRAKPYGIYQISLVMTRIMLVLVFVIALGMEWKGQLLGQAIAVILFALLSLIFVYRRGYLGFAINVVYVKDALKFGIPLIPHALAGWFRVSVDRIFLMMFIGNVATGLYSVGYQFGMIVGIIALAFNQAYSPYLYKKLVDISHIEKKRLVKFTYIYFIAILLFALLVSVVSPYIITHFLDSRYYRSQEFVIWVALGYAFSGMYLMVVNYIFFAKKTFSLSVITFISSILHVMLSYFLIKVNGEIGAAQATTISFFIMFVLVWILSAKVYHMPWGLR